MKPQIDFLGRQISTYALFSAIGILLSVWLLCFLLKKIGYPDSEGIYLVLISAGGAFLGSHILYGITRLGDFSQIVQQKPFYIAFVEIFGGSVFYGGLLGGILAGYIYLKCAKLEISVYSDISAVCMPLFHSFARVGCFFAGCCYGKEAEFGFSSSENAYIPDVVGVVRFPVQLCEAMCNFVLFVVLLLLFRNAVLTGKGKGRLFFVYLLSYSVIRFTLELFRGDLIRGIWWGLSTSQWISIMIFITVIVMITVNKLKSKKSFEN